MPPSHRMAAFALALGACAPSDSPLDAPSAEPGAAHAAETRTDWPAGTVLAVDDVPILAAEVDAATIPVQRIERRAVDAQLRRLALTNIVLPRLLTRLLGGEERARALSEARDALARLRAGE
ncbi:MAG TPA: hypothetical protein VMT18_15545, partial [Planctomycetota bacterium]|nr:hypothetical protein [Planctomycetota bacterium]